MADVFVPVFGSFGAGGLLCKRWFWQLVLTSTVLFPLTLPRSMHNLRHCSFFALALTVMMLFAIFGFSVDVLKEPLQRSHFDVYSNTSQIDRCTASHAKIPRSGDHINISPTLSFNLAQALAITSFAYLCHMNVFPIYKELANRSVRRMRSVERRAVVMSGAVFLGYGLFGYLTFLQSTQPNILTNYPVSGSHFARFMSILKFGFGISIMFSFPIIAWEARTGLEDLLFQGQPGDFRRHVFTNLGLVAFALLLGVLIPTIDIVVGFIGATCAPIMAYIMPSLLFLKAPHPSGNLTRIPIIGTVSIATWEHKVAIVVFFGSAFVLMPLAFAAWLALLLI